MKNLLPALAGFRMKGSFFQKQVLLAGLKPAEKCKFRIWVYYGLPPVCLLIYTFTIYFSGHFKMDRQHFNCGRLIMLLPD